MSKRTLSRFGLSWLLTIGIGLGSGVELVSIGQAQASTVLDRIAAVVNEEIILDSEVNQVAIQTLKSEVGEVDLSTAEGQRKFEAHRRKMLDMLIEKALIGQQAKELKIEVTEEEVRNAADSVRTQNNLSAEQFTEALKQQGFATIEDYRKALRKQLLQLKVVNQAVRSRISVGDDEVRTFYSQTVRQASGDQMQVHLHQIFMAVPLGASLGVVEDKRRLAMKIVADLRAGQDFATLAKKNGDDAASKAGGDLGWLQRGDLPEELREPVVTMDAGDIRGPISSERGLHILQLVEKKSGEVKPYEDVKEELRRQLYEQNMEKAISNWTKELRKKAHIDIRSTK